MALIEEMEKSGAWLFRWRSYLPFTLLAMSFVAIAVSRGPRESDQIRMAWGILSLFVSGVGLGIRAITIGHTPQGTSGRNTKRQVADTLNTTGIYSMVRNPLYLGNFFVGLGAAMFTQVWWLALVYYLSFFLYYERIIFAEESFLRDKFGEEYLRWAAVTPAMAPRMENYKKSTLPFSVRNVLKREYNGLLVIVFVFFLLSCFHNLVVNQRLATNRLWSSLLVVSFVVWMTLRTLKKKTTLLHVDGR